MVNKKMRDHNRGQKVGAKASLFDAWVDTLNPFVSEEYRKGVEHGYAHKRRRSLSDHYEYGKMVSSPAKKEKKQSRESRGSDSDTPYYGGTAQTGVLATIVQVLILLWFLRYVLAVVGLFLFAAAIGSRPRPEPAAHRLTGEQQIKLAEAKSEVEAALAWTDPPAVRFEEPVQVLSSSNAWYPAMLTVFSDGLQLKNDQITKLWPFWQIDRLELGSIVWSFPVSVHFNRHAEGIEYIQFGIGPLPEGSLPTDTAQRQLLRRLLVVYEAWRHSEFGQGQMAARERRRSVQQSLDTGREVSVSAVPLDQIMPRASQVRATNVTATSATITWDTNELADSQVEYCDTHVRCGRMTPTYSELTLTHAVELTDLTPNTHYFYWVYSRDAAGNRRRAGYFLLGTKREEQ